jgi:hypothetical protein
VAGAVDADPEGDHAGVLTEVHPIDHQRHQVQPRQVHGHQLGQRGLGRRDEPPVGAELVIHGGGLRHRWPVVVGHDRRSWRYNCCI